MITLSRFTLLASALAATALLSACSEQPADVKTAEAPQSAAAQSELKLTEVNPRLGEYIKTLA
ncbi:MAG TPA: peptidase M28, partial [Rheinheimera sp.]|nr:peptidase M28 [Rheinheimera sp.]